MKTRQEMIYDFMVTLASNAEFYKVWDQDLNDSVGSFGTHTYAFAEELADTFLKGLS